MSAHSAERIAHVGSVSITIEPRSAIAPYEQLRVRFMDEVRSGRLAAGTRLPTVRNLAEELGLAANTVARAYRELEADGFLETRGRNGSYVNAQGDVAERQAQEAARAYVDRVLKLGITRPQALAYVRAALDAS